MRRSGGWAGFTLLHRNHWAPDTLNSQQLGGPLPLTRVFKVGPRPSPPDDAADPKATADHAADFFATMDDAADPNAGPNADHAADPN